MNLADNTIAEISLVLAMIDEVISQYNDDELSEKCRKSGTDFFQFMESEGVNGAWCYSLIVETMGIAPQKLYKTEDFGLLRLAIANYESSIGVTPILQKESRQSDSDVAKNVAEFFFGRRNGL